MRALSSCAVDRQHRDSWKMPWSSCMWVHMSPWGRQAHWRWEFQGPIQEKLRGSPCNTPVVLHTYYVIIPLVHVPPLSTKARAGLIEPLPPPYPDLDTAQSDTNLIPLHPHTCIATAQSNMSLSISSCLPSACSTRISLAAS